MIRYWFGFWVISVRVIIQGKKVKASVNTEGLFSTLIKGGKSKGFFLLITVRERG